MQCRLIEIEATRPAATLSFPRAGRLINGGL
jgi:hypothetical protein